MNDYIFDIVGCHVVAFDTKLCDPKSRLRSY